MNATGGAGQASFGWLKQTSALCMRARPLPTRPIAHALAQTVTPQDPLEQYNRYPTHPLNAFFHPVVFRVSPPSGSEKIPTVKPASQITTPLQTGKGEYEVRLPQVLPESIFGHDASSRGYLAPELRLKSSHELHSLWYVLLMERNRLAVSRDEAKRLGLSNLLHLHRSNLPQRAHRVRKSMARIKRVLNERRLALIQAQQEVRQSSEAELAQGRDQGLLDAAAVEGLTDEMDEDELEEERLYEEEPEVAQAPVGTEAEGRIRA
ncbi:54S ribosomal protein L4 mitochondrial [Tilletia horrida]|uniref:Large ribosomal subunit protein uL29m n=1 Tax=Tilletia horrida TaxID=155126 RepID=A0AAN6GUA7_9BASI|nr:54S ribosomal protein L4 mitochondrial [Tilletia horrida]KAK0556840.1 54S ribosomal protein L4 mitochondrial [Tilletia horrida]KAK0569224.1 54S ribosomal protein L4 mitochondrial [Tilletia horrida]